MSLGETIIFCRLEGAIYMQEHPWIVCMGLLFFLAWGLLLVQILSLSSVCTGHYPLIGVVQVHSLYVLPQRWRQWMAPAGGAWYPGIWQWQWLSGRWGGAQSPWQKQWRGVCVSREVGATGGAWLQGPPWWWPVRWLGPQVVPGHTGPLVVVCHTHLWSPRWLRQFAPAPYIIR